MSTPLATNPWTVDFSHTPPEPTRCSASTHDVAPRTPRPRIVHRKMSARKAQGRRSAELTACCRRRPLLVLAQCRRCGASSESRPLRMTSCAGTTKISPVTQTLNSHNRPLLLTS